MNFLDALIALATLLGLAIGWMLRALRLVLLGGAIFAGILAAGHFAPQWLESFKNALPQFPGLAQFLASLVPFLIAALSLLLFGGVLAGMAGAGRIRGLDHALGALMAGALAIYLCGAVLVTSAPPSAWLKHSRLALPLARHLESLLARNPGLKLPGFPER